MLYNRPRYLVNFMNCTGLMDLDLNRHAFTWRGTRYGVLIEERIDRGLLNNQWQELWLNTIATHDTVMGSDHCPIVMQYEPDTKRGRKQFRFEVFLAKEEDCRELARSCWQRPCKGNMIDKWHKRINVC